jgi:hypothetical protein
MAGLKDTLIDQQKLVRELVAEIESVRLKRRNDWAQQSHPECKRFTQEELADLAYSSYKNLLLGRTQRLPNRAQMLQIADYLECTVAERNDLLLAAQYVPEQLEPQGLQLDTARDQAQAIMAALPLPALVVTRDWSVHATNQLFDTLLGLPRFAQLPPAQRTIFHQLFDPTLLVRDRLAVTPHAWQDTAKRVIDIFRRANLLHQYEPWYRERIRQLSALPDFNTFWNAELPSPDTAPLVTELFAGPQGTKIRYSNILITLNVAPYPGIIALVPADDAARHVFAELEIPMLENRWEQVLPTPALP